MIYCGPHYKATRSEIEDYMVMLRERAHAQVREELLAKNKWAISFTWGRLCDAI